MGEFVKKSDADHWSGLLFVVGVAVVVVAIVGGIYVLLELDAAHEKAMADRGYCWQYTVKHGGYAPCPAK